jgi:RES domain-containing protein
MLLWRISNYADLVGVGGVLASARWHSAGKPVVYLANHPASAVLEVIAHTNADDFPDEMQMLTVECKAASLYTPRLPSFWKVDTALTREIGDKWLSTTRSVLMKVPSALLPDTWNYVLNPAHSDAHKVTILKKQRFPIDPRLK